MRLVTKNYGMIRHINYHIQDRSHILGFSTSIGYFPPFP